MPDFKGCTGCDCIRDTRYRRIIIDPDCPAPSHDLDVCNELEPDD